MGLKLIRGYNRIVGLLWAVMLFLFFIYTTDFLPLWAALTFTASCAIPFYVACSYLTNHLQAKAIQEGRMNFFAIEFLIATLVMAVIYTSTCYLFHILDLYGYFPHSTLFDGMKPILLEILSTLPTFILLNLAFCGLRFYYEHSKLQQTLLESQLQMLQAQVNPHYMFNVLNHLHILMRKDVDRATFLLEKYSEVLRYQLYNGTKDSVPLSQEVKLIKDIISIEQLRWGEELSVEVRWEIEDSWKNIQPLLLVAFVENAFKHVSRSISEKGYVKLSLTQKNSVIYLEIENSKWKNKGIKKKNKSSGLGLSNTKERLDILYPGNYTLKIDETDWIYRVRLTINLDKKDE